MSAAGSVLVSQVMEYAFTSAGVLLERKGEVDRARALEAQGMAPEAVLDTLVAERKQAHGDLGDALNK
jgi:hypothetical protein